MNDCTSAEGSNSIAEQLLLQEPLFAARVLLDLLAMTQTSP